MISRQGLSSTDRYSCFLIHYHTMPHFDTLKINSCGKLENIVRKGEIACDKQFLLFSQCSLPYMAFFFFFHFKCTLKCLQFVSIWTSLKILSSGNGLIQLLSCSNIKSQLVRPSQTSDTFVADKD